MPKQTSQFAAISGLLLLSSAGLQAQFFTNSREAIGYGIVLDQGHAAVQSATRFALANAGKAQVLSYGYDFANFETDRRDTRLFKGDIDQSAAHLNYGHAFGDFVAAVQLSYFDSQANSDFYDGPGTEGSVEIDSTGWFLGSTLGYEWNGFNFTFVAGLGNLSNDSTRRAVGVPKNGDFDSEFYTFGFNTIYTVYDEGSFSVSPRLGLVYNKVDVDSFVESPATAFDDGSLDSVDRDWLIGSLDVLFDWQASEWLTLQALLGWHYDFSSDSTTLSGTDFTGVREPVTIPDVGESYFKGGLSADFAINENWSLGADTSFLSGDDLSGFSVGASLGYRF